MSKVRVLIVDDSAIVRQILIRELSKDPNIEVIGSAPDPYEARDKIVTLKPDVITLDVEMPRMDGITFLSKLMKHYPIPVIIVSSHTKKGADSTLNALEIGAIDVFEKPNMSKGENFDDISMLLREKVISASNANIKRKIKMKEEAEKKTGEKRKIYKLTRTTDKVVLIGASTGGTEAIKEVLTALPPDFPGILITQHMPALFTDSFAERLDSLSKITVREAKDGDMVREGLALLAPGNFHMVLKRTGGHYYVNVKNGPMVHHQRPSVDVMFLSASKSAGENALGIILTGMGSDGAKGLLSMKEAGAYTIAEHEKTCIVYGMPRAAVEMGAVEKILPLDKIVANVIGFLNKSG
ncbi:MAG: chemotaxis response regulator protein-glutamate methylesterase [Candidatus Aureabacteria bacterium]|nr:chemotaxis response regulator protein-glutamate methylesterase [Candidatus Auribacterota bacterium]